MWAGIQLAGMRRAQEMMHTTQEEATSLCVRCDALKKSKCIADAVRSGGSQLRRVEKRVD
jgi:hypothetical protein